MTKRLADSFLLQGLLASSLALLLTILLECLSLDQVQKLLQKKGGKELYKQALVANIVNVLFLGTFTYWFTVAYVCHRGPLTLMEQIQGSTVVILVEGLLYYLIHKAFHQVKGLYWAHSFHHRFNQVVLPSSANAVSMTEFVVAYMTPITVACSLVPNDRASTVGAATVIAITNLLIHTPFMKGRNKYCHWIFVTADDHFQHHQKITTAYGAPIISYDRLLATTGKA